MPVLLNSPKSPTGGASYIGCSLSECIMLVTSVLCLGGSGGGLVLLDSFVLLGVLDLFLLVKFFQNDCELFVFFVGDAGSLFLLKFDLLLLCDVSTFILFLFSTSVSINDCLGGRGGGVVLISTVGAGAICTGPPYGLAGKSGLLVGRGGGDL